MIANLWKVKTMEKFLNILEAAISEQRKLKITYRAVNKMVTTRIITPVEFLYLGTIVSALDEKKNEYRRFKITGIQSLEAV